MVRMKHTSLNFTVLIEQDEDGMYIAKVPDIQGCYPRAKP
ncbi:MAG: type II toxin-antitoxin system HicB family antitoxin [Candidatus Methanoperedens sp.]|nr:type II toxin-antitoxin system HicB family antitoxin [Candidatus Methanoperedens sp.]